MLRSAAVSVPLCNYLPLSHFNIHPSGYQFLKEVVISAPVRAECQPADTFARAEKNCRHTLPKQSEGYPAAASVHFKD